MLEFRVLGPVEIRVADQVFDLGPPKQRAVVAALVVDAGRPVTVETLVDRVWGDDPPTEARNALYAHIMRVRRALRRAGQADGAQATLVRGPAGYTLDIDRDCVDLHRFRRLVRQSCDRGDRDDQRVRLLSEALAPWGGTPLAGLSGAWVERVRDSCCQQRIDAVVTWARAELRLRNHDLVRAQVADLVGEYPLVEPLSAVLMRALYAAGRAAEALVCYATVRQRLADELGTDPGAELQALHQAVLKGEPKLPVTTPAPAPTMPHPGAVPAQLPADVRGFTGRRAELTQLDSILVTVGQQPTSVVISALPGTAGVGKTAQPDTRDCAPTAVLISAVSGTAGVGKTALALHWAHQVRGSFPDGQLYVNLRGYDPAQPLSAADALARFLRALGVAGKDIPPETDERAAAYRTLLDGQRTLVVLDNAGTVEQVRPLLPGTPSCAVLVTSRDSLAGLVAVHGAHRLDLDVLPPADAVALLRALIGRRVDTEPEAAAALTVQCARLPLALRVAAELAAAHPAACLTDLVGELADQQRRLDLLDSGGDPHAAVRSVFSWSYQRLPTEAARTFRLLGLHPGPDLDAYATAALTATSLHHADRLLDLLARAHLVHPTGPGRYGMHDLLRAYAAQRHR